MGNKWFDFFWAKPLVNEALHWTPVESQVLAKGTTA